MKLNEMLARVAGVVLLLGFNVATAAENDVQLTIVVNTVAQDDSPVQITGIKIPGQVNGRPTVLFRNSSGKAIRRIQFYSPIGSVSEPDTGNPGNRKFYAYGSRAKQQIHTVGPGESGEDTGQLPRSTSIVSTAMLLKSNCVQMTVLVGHVEFADGTTWNIAGGSGALWKQALAADAPQTCGDFLSARAAVANLRGSAMQVIGQPSHVDQPAQDHYSYSCTMLKDEKYEHAHCPF